MKAPVGAFNQEKALVGAFSVIVKTDCETDGSFYSTSANTRIKHSAQLSGVMSSGGQQSGDQHSQQFPWVTPTLQCCSAAVRPGAGVALSNDAFNSNSSATS